jgi:DNA-binding NarL/FixJ family response regulator
LQPRRLGLDEGIQVPRKLRTSHPEIGVVVLSQFADPGYALALLESGSAGRAYLLKERVSEPRVTLTKRAVEKHINAIFMKLNLAPSDDVSPRVKATLAYLANDDGRSAP